MTDHKDEATFHGGELPRREPFETLGSWDRQAQPAPPVNPGRPWTSPGTPPWGSLSQDIGHEAPRKRSRAWVWVLVAAVLVVACGFGALALAGAGGKAVVDTVNQEAADRKADVKITGCSVDQFGLATVSYTIHNDSAEAVSYVPEFNIESKTGTVYGQAADIVNDLAPGKDYKGKAVAGATVDGGAKIVCTLTGA